MDPKTNDTLAELVALAAETVEHTRRTAKRAESILRELVLRLEARAEVRP